MSVTVRVKDIMDNKVVYVDASDTITKAIEEMINNKVWSVVVERRGLPSGVVTERDIIRRCAVLGKDPGSEPIENIMSSPLISIDPDSSVGDAVKLMLEKSIRRLYVIKSGKIIGRVTKTKTFANMLDIVTELAEIPFHHNL